MARNKKIEIRCLKDGDWYWINKRILNLYGRRLRPSGIAVYNALASFANSKTQACFPTQRTMADLIGVCRRTVIRKIKILKELSLLKVEKIRGKCYYQLLKPEVKVTSKVQAGDKRCTLDATRGNINKNYITRINNNVNGEKKFLNLKSFKGFKPRSREELLALDLAKGLNDLKSFHFYLSVARQFPEQFLRKLLGEVREIPYDKLKKSRAALFNYLLKQYGKENSKNNRH